MKSRFVLVAFVLLIPALLSPKYSSADDYPPSMLYVSFQPEAIDSLWTDSTGMPCCGLSRIDSINQANHCSYFLCHADSGLHEELNCYHIIFGDTEGVDLPALAEAYRQDPNVAAVSPDYYTISDFTPNAPPPIY